MWPLRGSNATRRPRRTYSPTTTAVRFMYSTSRKQRNGFSRSRLVIVSHPRPCGFRIRSALAHRAAGTLTSPLPCRALAARTPRPPGGGSTGATVPEPARGRYPGASKRLARLTTRWRSSSLAASRSPKVRAIERKKWSVTFELSARPVARRTGATRRTCVAVEVLRGHQVVALDRARCRSLSRELTSKGRARRPIRPTGVARWPGDHERQHRSDRPTRSLRSAPREVLGVPTTSPMSVRRQRGG
jgi:hypothetical protein